MTPFLLTALLASSVVATTESTKLEHSRLRGESTSTVSTPMRALQDNEEYLDAVRNREEYQELLDNSPSNNYFHRIVGGNQVDRTNNPYSYYVEMGGCGGALIAPDVVLFAAHCGDWSNREVIIGAYETKSAVDAETRFCIEWVKDQEYNVAAQLDSDFALCKLDKPVYTDSTVTLELNEDDPLSDGEMLTVVGLGTLASGGSAAQYLQEVDVPVVTNEECDDLYSSNSGLSSGAITDRMMCAGLPGVGGKDSCQGDSGGPLVKKSIKSDGSIVHTHVGVVSWGIGCADKRFPGVYARTSTRVGWIKDKMCNDFQSVADFCNNSPPEPCDGIEMSVQIETDKYGRETSWNLYDVEHSLITRRKYYANFHASETKVCLPSAQACYDLEIKDSYGDGMCVSGNCGSYRMFLNGAEEIDGDPAFGSSETHRFCTKATPVTATPTGSPTTDMPTGFPTQVPTVSASDSPTLAPSPSATATDSPSASPSAAPSASPSASPSESPTLAPSPSPTLSPTEGTEVQVCTLGNDSTFRWKNKNNKTCWKFIKGSNVKKNKNKCNKMWEGKRVREWCPERCGLKAGVGQCMFLAAAKSKTAGTATVQKKKKQRWNNIFAEEKKG